MAERRSQLVLGVDPDPAALWPAAAPENGRAASSPLTGAHARAEERAVAAVLEHCRALIEATAAACVGVKLQLARFEALGAGGWGAVHAIAAHARELGLLVIADGKRGDIDVSAQAYARGLLGGLDTPFGPVAGLEADLLTVNPLMGRDALEPFVSAAREAGAGVLVLVRTSNAGAADIQDLELKGGERVWERIAMIVDQLGAANVSDGGLSDVGAVLGATQPAHLARARQLMASATFLLPGVGAQGGRVDDLAAAFAPGRAAGLVTASRAIADAHRTHGGAPADAAREQAERLREQAWFVSGAAGVESSATRMVEQ